MRGAGEKHPAGRANPTAGMGSRPPGGREEIQERANPTGGPPEAGAGTAGAERVKMPVGWARGGTGAGKSHRQGPRGGRRDRWRGPGENRPPGGREEIQERANPTGGPQRRAQGTIDRSGQTALRAQGLHNNNPCRAGTGQHPLRAASAVPYGGRTRPVQGLFAGPFPRLHARARRRSPPQPTKKEGCRSSPLFTCASLEISPAAPSSWRSSRCSTQDGRSWARRAPWPRRRRLRKQQ